MTDPPPQPRTSYRTAYVLCLLFGWLGFHRFYLRHWWTGLLYAVTGGLCGIGVLVDLLTLPLLVRERRDVESGIPKPPARAEWAEDEQASWWNWFQLLLRYGIVAITPPITVLLALSLEQYVVAGLVFLILGFSFFVGSIGRALYALEDMKGITGRLPQTLQAVLGITTRFENHYTEHRAGSVFYYLFYPLLGPPSILFSPRARSEFRTFLSLFSVMMVGLVVQNAVSYRTLFPFEYSDGFPLFGFFVCTAVAIAGILLFFVCVVPLVSSTFYLSKTGRSFSLRTTAAVGLVLSGCAVAISALTTSVGIREALTIQEKLNSPTFKQHLTRASSLFLIGEMRHLRLDEELISDDSEIESGGDDKLPQVTTDADLTAWYRKMLTALVRDDEAETLSVLSVRPGDGSLPWLAVRLDPGTLKMGGSLGGTVLLYVITPDERVITRWSDLTEHAEHSPPEYRGRSFQECFQLPNSTSRHYDLDETQSKHWLTAPLLVDDLEYVPILGPLSAGIPAPETFWQRLKLAPTAKREP